MLDGILTLFVLDLVVHAMVVFLIVGVMLQVKATVIMVMVISPAGLLIFSMMLLVFMVLRLSLVVVAPFIVTLHICLMLMLMLVLGCVVGVFFLKGSAEIFLKLLLLSNMSLMWLQVRQGLVQLRHEDLVVGLAEIRMVVSTELVVAVDHVADSAHHPLDCVHGADSVSVTVHNSDGSLSDVLDGDISCGAVLLALHVGLSVLLEASFDTHLEVMGE